MSAGGSLAACQTTGKAGRRTTGIAGYLRTGIAGAREEGERLLYFG